MAIKNVENTPNCFGRWSDVCKEDCHCERADEDLCFIVESEMDGVTVITEETQDV